MVAEATWQSVVSCPEEREELDGRLERVPKESQGDVMLVK